MKGNGMRGKDQWEALRQRINSTPANRRPNRENTSKMPVDSSQLQKTTTGSQGTSGEPKKVRLTLDVTVPRVHLSRQRKKAGILLAGAVVTGLIGLGAYTFITRSNSNDTRDVLSEAVAEPEYDTVLPEGKKEETEGGRIGYDSQRKVASFKDTIGNVQVTVSQQPLPESFKANPDEEVKKIAENFSASEVINEANPKVYLGNDVQGPQTVIFHKSNVLVFILSPRPITNEQWVAYIATLR